MKPISTPAAPAARGHYSQAIVHGGLVYVAGQLPIVPAEPDRRLADFDAQARQVIANVLASPEGRGKVLGTGHLGATLRAMPKRAASPEALDGNALRTQRTRARVLAESLKLFNEVGEAQVTTGTIAAALNMSPGNLYYHFRNKDQIIDELFAQFEERIDVQPNQRGSAAEAIEDLWLYLHLMLEAIWEYRFLYRNLDDLLGRNRKLREHFGRIVERKYQVVLALFEALARGRALRGRPEELRALARNVLLVATYWLSFSSLGGWRGAGPAEGAQVGQGAYQVMALIAPFLVGEAKAHLESLGRNYID